MFFIVFEWGRILESPIDKQEVKSNAELRRNDFSVKIKSNKKHYEIVGIW